MNKRHYEHTLPNIRGSLSNTYRQSPVKGNVRGRFIIPCRVSREPTFASVHGISFSPRFSPITFSSLFFHAAERGMEICCQ